MVQVNLSAESRDSLMQLKYELKKKSLDEVVKLLLKTRKRVKSLKNTREIKREYV